MLEKYLPGLPGPQAGKMFMHLANGVSARPRKAGRIEIPVYALSASKPRDRALDMPLCHALGLYPLGQR